MILASALTHLTARHSVTRQNPESATAQTAIMNKLTMYIFPLGVLVFGLFFPIGLLLYWLANNTWTLMQQRIVYRRIDAEEQEKKEAAIEKRSNLAPKPGQRPAQAKKRPAGTQPADATNTSDDTAAPKATTPKTTGAKPTGTTRTPGTAKPGTAKTGVTKATGTAKPGTAKPGTKSTAKPSGTTKPGTTKSTGSTPKAAGNGASDSTGGDGSTVSGLSADRSRKKNTGRKNR